MPQLPTPYDPTLRALFSPGKAPPATGFSTAWSRDQICAELSRRAYVRYEKHEQQRLADELSQAGFVGQPKCFHNKWTGAQAFGTVGPDGTVYVAFRGTQITSPSDLISDLLAVRVRWPGSGRVDWGFWRAYRSLRGAIDGWLAEQRGNALVVTGHSLGAAMATLMAALHEQAALVTFGSPRVGNRDFAQSFTASRTLRRYVDTVDGVPGLPPAFIGYDHLGEMIYIDHLGALHSPPPGQAALKADARAARKRYRRCCAFRLGNVPVRSGADHAPVNYVSALLGQRTGP